MGVHQRRQDDGVAEVDLSHPRLCGRPARPDIDDSAPFDVDPTLSQQRPDDRQDPLGEISGHGATRGT